MGFAHQGLPAPPHHRRWQSWIEKAPLLAHVGNTPLLPLRRIAQHVPGVEIYAKAEWFNPGGSVKDRAALWMI
ncbi:MAG TPA: pyridoxal-phosphate dependent enzyme, partial [Limnochordales bacterium]